MRLTDLNPEWLGNGGPGIYQISTEVCEICKIKAQIDCDLCLGTGFVHKPVPRSDQAAIEFDCPCGSKECTRCCITFKNTLDAPVRHLGERGWDATGSTFENLTLSPSIQRVGGCRWHGYIRDGEIVNA